jgi:hypothetical protein
MMVPFMAREVPSVDLGVAHGRAAPFLFLLPPVFWQRKAAASWNVRSGGRGFLMTCEDGDRLLIIKGHLTG